MSIQVYTLLFGKFDNNTINTTRWLSIIISECFYGKINDFFQSYMASFNYVKIYCRGNIVTCKHSWKFHRHWILKKLSSNNFKLFVDLVLVTFLLFHLLSAVLKAFNFLNWTSKVLLCHKRPLPSIWNVWFTDFCFLTSCKWDA